MNETTPSPRWDTRWNSLARYVLDEEILGEVSMSHGAFHVLIDSHLAQFPDAASAKQHVEQIVQRAMERASAGSVAASQ